MSFCVRLMYSVPTNILAYPCLFGVCRLDDDTVPADIQGIRQSASAATCTSVRMRYLDPPLQMVPNYSSF